MLHIRDSDSRVTQSPSTTIVVPLPLGGRLLQQRQYHYNTYMKGGAEVKKKTQRETNPYKYSDTNKRYHTFDYYTRHTFGGKCARIPLDAGFS